MGNGEISQLRTIFDTRGLPPESDWPSESNISRQSFLPEQRRVSILIDFRSPEFSANRKFRLNKNFRNYPK